MRIIFDEGVWVRMVLVRLQQFLPHGHGYAIGGQNKLMESVFVFDNTNEWITQWKDIYYKWLHNNYNKKKKIKM